MMTGYGSLLFIYFLNKEQKKHNISIANFNTEFM